jgi:hypothetical protein
LLYAGTEHGMYVSFDDGENWNSLQLNLPDVAIRDLAVTEKDIAIATHGRSMWILDDISPIREYSKEYFEKGPASVHFLLRSKKCSGCGISLSFGKGSR